MENNKKVLFICKGNWYRSQMAEAIYNKLTNSKDAHSVGACAGDPGEPVGQKLSDLFKKTDFFEVMESHGMNVRDKVTKRLLPEMLDQYDTIVSMVEEPFIPEFLKNHEKVIWWSVENPEFVDKNVAEGTYEKIEKLVKDLINIKNTTLKA